MRAVEKLCAHLKSYRYFPNIENLGIEAIAKGALKWKPRRFEICPLHRHSIATKAIVRDCTVEKLNWLATTCDQSINC